MRRKPKETLFDECLVSTVKYSGGVFYGMVVVF